MVGLRNACSEDKLQEPVLSFHRACMVRNETQVTKLCTEHLFLLSHLAHPWVSS